MNALYDIIYDKVTLQNMSSMMRVKAWRSAILDFQSSPWIGVGPAYSNEFYSGFGYQNAYFKLMGETGIFSLVFFMLFFGVIYLKILRLEERAKPLFFMAISAGLFHWFIADTYYHFTIWVVAILVQLMFIEYRMGKKQEAEQS
jgi:O-antigen ligase